MQRGDQGAEWLFWLVAVGFLFAAGLSLLNDDSLGAISAALFSASFVLTALGGETPRRRGARLLGWVLATMALLLSLSRLLFA